MLYLSRPEALGTSGARITAVMFASVILPESGGIFDVAFSPDGTRLATAGKDGNVRLYVLSIEELVDLANFRLTRSLTPEECQQFLHLDECPDGL